MQIVAGAVETRNVVASCTNELLRTMLPTLLEQLEMCQKSLTAYLETKRAEFPRFYFVSDPTLLEILSLGSDPAAVVPHFQSGLFDSLTSVTFDKACCRVPHAYCTAWVIQWMLTERCGWRQVDKCKMLEMFSQQAEMVEFENPVDAKGVPAISLLHCSVSYRMMQERRPLNNATGVLPCARHGGGVAAAAGGGHAGHYEGHHQARGQQRQRDGPPGLHLQPPRPDCPAGAPIPVDSGHPGAPCPSIQVLLP